jgi:hypothetical protein
MNHSGIRGSREYWQMTAEFESNLMTAQGLALEVAAFGDKLTAAGADVSLLAGAFIGCGVELLRRIQSPEQVATTLERVADNIRNRKPGGAPATVN